MKHFFLLTVLLTFLISCNKENAMKPHSDSSLDFRFSKLETKSTSPQSGDTTTILNVNGSEILWYNNSTGEIKFKDNLNIATKMLGYSPDSLKVYNKDKLLFVITVTVTPVVSQIIDEPVLCCIANGEEKQFFIKNGYPEIEVLANPEAHQQYRTEQWDSIQLGWNEFITQLKDDVRYSN